MNDLGCILAIFLLLFLFWGEPDVWDVLHAKAMGQVMSCPQHVKPEAKKNNFYF